MQSTLNPKQNDDPHDILVVAPDVALVVPTDEELSRLAYSMRQPPGPPPRAESGAAEAPAIPPVDTTFRPAVSDVPSRRTIGGRLARAFTTAMLLALGTGATAFAWDAYGDAAKQMIAPWVPQHVLAALLPADKPAPPAQPAAVEAAAADNVPPQPAPAAQAAPDTVAPAAAAPPVEPAAQLRSMAQDIAGMGQEIAQLKASIEELKSGQQQMSREIAKASEAKASEARLSDAKAPGPNLRSRISSLPPRPPVRVRKPAPLVPAQQAATYPALPRTAAPQAAAPYVPRQAEPPPQGADQTLTDPELTSVPRPPMPLR